jgi:hypothetical protein
VTILLMAAVAAGAGEGRRGIAGEVVDAEGAPIAGARVAVRAGPWQDELCTGPDGRFAITSLRDTLHRRVRLRGRAEYAIEVWAPDVPELPLVQILVRYRRGWLGLDPVVLDEPALAEPTPPEP